MKLKPFVLTLLAVALAAPVLAWALPQLAFEGKPDFRPASATGAFVWKSGSWYHVRFTSEQGPVRFHGKVCVPGRIHSVCTVLMEGGDSVSIDQEDHCVSFSFMNKRHLDGFRFQTDSDRIEFEFNLNTDPLDPERIWIGVDNLHPQDSPFSLVPDRKTLPRRSARSQ